MKTLGLLLAALAAVGSTGCTKVDTFNCLQSSECLLAGVAGVCEPGNLCSFPDPECPSGKAYGEYAGDQASQCVGAGPGTTSLSDTGTSNPTGTGSGTGVDPGTTTAVDPTTVATDTTATSDPVTSDPATSDPTMTSDPSTTGPACAALGGACGGTPCCGGACTVCDAGTCTALPAEMGPSVCGSSCMTCAADGECAPAPPDQSCPLDCGIIVRDLEILADTTTCNGYGKMALNGTCGNGQCSVPDPMLSCDPVAPANVIAQCDTACAQNIDLCTPGAVGVDKAEFCYLDTTSPDCKPTCSPDLLSSNTAACDAEGACQSSPKPCGLYTCNGATGMCRTKCMANSDCVSNKCQGTKCQ